MEWQIARGGGDRATGTIENKVELDRQKIGAPLALPYVADAQVFELSSLGDDLGLVPFDS